MTYATPDLTLSEVTPGGELDLENALPYEREKNILWNPLFWVCLLMAGSAYKQLRFSIGGMSFHPYMFALGLLIFRAIPRLHRFPGRIGRPASLFLFLYVLSLIQGTSFIVQLVKIGVMAVTLILFAASVRSKEDFIAGAYGLGACAAILCVKGFIRGVGEFGSINPIEGAQKNAFSLFYLPALTICLHLLTTQMVRLNRKTVLACIVTLIFGGIALSKNRSGWLASGALLLLVFGTNRARFKMLFFIGIGFALALIIAKVVLSEAEYVYERDAANEERSDMVRFHLFERAVMIGLQHPMLGVSPTRLTRMLGTTVLQVEEDGIDCHNLTGYLLGGCGVFTFAAFCLFAFSMGKPPKRVRAPDATPMMRSSSRVLTLLTCVWILRAQFQEDVIFSPTFTSGLGLCIGFCIATGVYGKDPAFIQPEYVPDPEPRRMEEDWEELSPHQSNGPAGRPLLDPDF
jgi:hypothetical protein